MPSNTISILRAALYARVSTEEQREGQTINSQVSELEHFAREKQWQVVGVYKDDGWSGSLLARPELDRLRDDASKQLFDIVIINDVDRLARDVSHLGIVKRGLEKHGVQVVFRKLPADKSPTYNLMVNILGSFAEFERELILDRTRRGRRHKVEVRQLHIGSIPPYGYRYIHKDKATGKEGHLEVNPEEAVVVKRIFEWVGKEGLSARKVTKRLTDIKATPRKGGGLWGKSSVLRILRCETYTGIWHYNKHELCEPKNLGKSLSYKRSLKCSLRKRDKSEWLPVKLPEHLKIVDRNLWEHTQRQLDRNTSFSSRNSKHNYLLSGLIRCGGCGGRYVGDPCHGRFYYRCFARCKKYSMIREEVINQAVWQAIKEAILNPSIIANQLAKVYRHRTSNSTEVKTEQEEIEAALMALRKEEERILEAYRLNILSPEQLRRECEKLNARKKSLEERRSKLSQIRNAQEFPAIRRSLLDYCKIVAGRLKDFNREQQKRFLQLIVDEIAFEGTQVRIIGILPISERKTDYTVNEDTYSSPPEVFSKGGIANIMLYSHDRNSVDGISFELLKDMPEKPPLHHQLGEDFLHRLVEQDPNATLQQYCQLIQQQCGMCLSQQTLCKLLTRIGLSGQKRRRIATASAKALAT